MNLHHFTPRLLKRLLGTLDPKKAEELLGRFAVPAVALHAPAGQDTWGVKTVLRVDQAETDRIPLEFPAGAVVIGFFAAATCATYGGFSPAPQVIDFDVAIDIDNKEKATSRQSSNKSEASFANLGAVHILAPRLLMLWLDSARPQLGITFRSRYAPATGGSGLPGDVILSVDAITMPVGY